MNINSPDVKSGFEATHMGLEIELRKPMLNLTPSFVALSRVSIADSFIEIFDNSSSLESKKVNPKIKAGFLEEARRLKRSDPNTVTVDSSIFGSHIHDAFELLKENVGKNVDVLVIAYPKNPEKNTPIPRRVDEILLNQGYSTNIHTIVSPELIDKVKFENYFGQRFPDSKGLEFKIYILT